MIDWGDTPVDMQNPEASATENEAQMSLETDFEIQNKENKQMPPAPSCLNGQKNEASEAETPNVEPVKEVAKSDNLDAMEVSDCQAVTA